MSRVTIERLGDAIAQELTLYADEVRKAVDEAGADALAELVERTKATAPRGDRKTHYARRISSEAVQTARGTRHIWYVKAPDYRLTHLLVHGHATPDGGRTKANPFLQDALDAVLPKYERDVEEALR